MILPNDYDSARAYDGSNYNALPVGGHVCRIIGARETKSRNNNDMIEVAFDIFDGGPEDGRFQKRFNELRSKQAAAKWPNGGMFRTAVLTKEGKTSGFFKGFITSVEESNPGYSFKASGCNMDSMKGKLVGFNFGEEEYPAYDNSIKTAVKAFYAVSVQTVKEGIEPPPKKPYKGAGAVQSAASQGFTEVQDDELPF